MNVQSCSPSLFHSQMAGEAAARLERSTQTSGDQQAGDAELRKAFDSFVGESFYGQLFQAMRKTVGKPAYFHGGRAEEAFQAQLDQLLTEKMSQSGAGHLSESMYELFRLQR